MFQLLLRSGVRSSIRIHIRNKTWYNPLSRFGGRKPQKSVVSEVEKVDDREKQYLQALKHYTRSQDVSGLLRKGIIRSKLIEYIDDVDYLSKDGIANINYAFNELYKLNERNLVDVLPSDKLMRLFELTSSSILLHERMQLPKYMTILIQYYMKDLRVVSPKMLVKLVLLGSKLSRFEIVLSKLLTDKGEFITSQFTNELIQYFKHQNKLNLGIYEQLVELSTLNGLEIFDDQFFQGFIEYVESLFQDNYPKIHEYKDLDRNLDRVQFLVNTIIADLKPEKVSTFTNLSLLKLNQELANSINNSDSKLSNDKILSFLNSDQNKQIHYQEVRNQIFKQNLGDESLVEILLYLTRSSPQYNDFAKMLTEFILSDDIKFSYLLRFQASIYELFLNPKSENELTDAVINIITSIESEDDFDINEIFTRIMQCLLTSSISPRGYFTQTLTNYLSSKYALEQSLYSYKYRIDRAVTMNDFTKAINIFEDSIQAFAPWASTLDPAIQKTLNDLIVVICNNIDNIDDIFPIFTKIKQQMVNSSCNIESISALAKKMLQAEYVGDVIELLKREFPKIKKDTIWKLPNDKPYGVKYNQLFDYLHNFVITYNNEETHETNWVLYGELHKYFHVPFASYLPAMQFFCKNGRLNAALIVLRQVKKLNELHGNHNYLPPLREMYLLLFQEFGDKLYEEGVIEVHEYLKMDLDMEKQDLALQNSILNAYANLQDVPRARDLFLAMSANKDHINEETIQIMIKAYTYNDLAYVQKFFNNLSQFGIIPNYAVYKQYLIAHVYHGLVEEALKLTEEMDDYDLKVSSDTLLALHNFTLEKEKQTLVSTWAAKNYPKEWKEVQSSGLLTTATNYVPDTNLIAGSSN